MQTPDKTTADPPLSEAEMRRVLARAGELDAAKKFVVTQAELEVVADEAGISRDALQQALRELRETPDPVPITSDPAPKRKWSPLAVSAVLGGLLGVLTNLAESAPYMVVRYEWGALLVLGGMLGRSLQQAFTHPLHESKLLLQAELAVLWATYAGGYVFTGGDAGPEAVPFIGRYWVLAAGTGAVITFLRSLFRKESQQPSNQPE